MSTLRGYRASLSSKCGGMGKPSSVLRSHFIAVKAKAGSISPNSEHISRISYAMNMQEKVRREISRTGYPGQWFRSLRHDSVP